MLIYSHKGIDAGGGAERRGDQLRAQNTDMTGRKGRGEGEMQRC